MHAKPDLFVEFKDYAMHVLDHEHGMDIPIEREPNGRVCPTSIERAAAQLRAFLAAHGPGPRLACCSIPARGVTLRRMSIPSVEKEDVRRLLSLQLEAQLPVAPSELAWGCAPLFGLTKEGSSAASLQEFLVAAVKKELLEDYTRILANAGVDAEYTIGALVRGGLCQNSPDQFSVLDSSRTRSELASFDARGPVSLRVLPWGTEKPASMNGALDGAGQKLYVTDVLPPGFPKNDGLPIEALPRFAEKGRTAANLGLRKSVENGGNPLFLGSHEMRPAKPPARQWKWVALAVVLALAVLALRYTEALVYRARLSKKLAAISSYRSTLPKIEREFNFLNYLKTNQPPHLDTLAVLAQAAPPGTRIDTFSLLRNGDLSLRGSVADAQAPGTFRSKLIDSGFFSRVVVEEQAPTPDAQKFNFRISAQLKPDGARKPLSPFGATNAAALAPSPTK